MYQNKIRGNEEVINILTPVVENFSRKITHHELINVIKK
jgi:hypothetical protein